MQGSGGRLIPCRHLARPWLRPGRGKRPIKVGCFPFLPFDPHPWMHLDVSKRFLVHRPPFFSRTTCPCLVHNNNVRTCTCTHTCTHTHTHTQVHISGAEMLFWIPISSLVLPAQARATRGLQSCRRGTLEARGKDSSGWGHCADLDSTQNTSHQRRKRRRRDKHPPLVPLPSTIPHAATLRLHPGGALVSFPRCVRTS